MPLADLVPLQGVVAGIFGRTPRFGTIGLLMEQNEQVASVVGAENKLARLIGTAGMGEGFAHLIQGSGLARLGHIRKGDGRGPLEALGLLACEAAPPCTRSVRWALPSRPHPEDPPFRSDR